MRVVVLGMNSLVIVSCPSDRNAAVIDNIPPESPPSPEQMRSRLLALAYRMLGTVADAEDAVQDAYVRFQQARDIEKPDAWLVKTTTRLCIDRLRQAKRRAGYSGSWLPEPISDRWDGAAQDRTELAESLSMAFLVLLETLSPAERAAYLLREVFDYDFEQIATLLDKSPVNVRQITARAKKRLNEKERRFTPHTEHVDELAQRFYAACQSGDMPTIEALLADDAMYFSDGGGKVHAAPKPFGGTHRIAKLLSTVFRKRMAACDLRFATVNGQPGVVFSLAGQPIHILSFAVEAGRIGSLYSMLNPDKLQHWSPPSPESLS